MDPAQWCNRIAYFAEVEGQPRLLLCWVTGDAAEVADGLEDVTVIEAVTRLLRRVTGDLALPPPDRLLRSVTASHQIVQNTIINCAHNKIATLRLKAMY